MGDILEELRQISHMSAKQAEGAYVEFCRKWPFFGQEFYNVEQSIQVGNIPKRFTLGISWYGVHFLEPTSKTLLQRYAFSEIANWGFSNNTFILIAGDLRKQSKFLLKTPGQVGSEISGLVQAFMSRAKA